MIFDRVWYWRAWLPERKGQRCRIVAAGAMGTRGLRAGRPGRTRIARRRTSRSPAAAAEPLLATRKFGNEPQQAREKTDE